MGAIPNLALIRGGVLKQYISGVGPLRLGLETEQVIGAHPLAVTARAVRLAAPAERNSTTTSQISATAATAVPVYPPPRT